MNNVNTIIQCVQREQKSSIRIAIIVCTAYKMVYEDMNILGQGPRLQPQKYANEPEYYNLLVRK